MPRMTPMGRSLQRKKNWEAYKQPTLLTI